MDPVAPARMKAWALIVEGLGPIIAAQQLAAADPAGVRKDGDALAARMRQNGATVARAAGQLPAQNAGRVPTGLLREARGRWAAGKYCGFSGSLIKSALSLVDRRQRWM